ncbi:hypothetical protein O3M35_004201 [Rhynocoris fuscipes]|uniref:PNPLA domain-containing protein n=1 Tax=Rhynocoris fuscipes TaxID=488301 RepID=A0AAW1CHM7_9HEMI
MKSKIIKVPDTKIPEWKTLNLASSRESVNVKTLRLLSGLVAADKISSRLRRLEDLYHHLLAHPETIAFACKRNAVQILLVMKNSQRDKITLELIGQLLAIFGYVDPPKSRGLRILSIDGGGMRGIAVIKMLEKIENLSGKKVYELFDFICGVSTGAIIACCLVPPHCMPLDKVHQLYRTMSSKVFNQSAFWGTSKLMWNHAYYDTAIWENLLKDYVGNSVLIDTAKYSNCPKIAVISTIVNHSKVAPYIFRNYGNPYNRSSEYHGGFQHSMFEAIRASAAAPTIFEEFRTGNILHQDGGIIVNNPTAVALHEAKLLWPNEHISCIVSCGTGRYDPLPMTDQLRNLKEGSTSWKSMLDKILESATDTESIHTLISDILPEGVYFRLNPHLSGMVSMDDINDERISRLEEDTNMYCRRNEEKFVEISKILVTKRSVFQQTYDKLLYHTKLFKSKIN